MARPIRGFRSAIVADTPGTCSVAGGILTAVAPGPCSVTASQPGDATFAPADNVQATTTIDPQPPDPVAQTITFALPSSTLVGSSLVLGGDGQLGPPRRLRLDHAARLLGQRHHADGARGRHLHRHRLAARRRRVPPGAGCAASMAVEAVPAGRRPRQVRGQRSRPRRRHRTRTGRTFLGGDFTQIGVRTGPVAVVEPPDLGTGKLRPASPEVLGTVRFVFEDDRPNDPGFFIVGQLIAVNGTPSRSHR